MKDARRFSLLFRAVCVSGGLEIKMIKHITLPLTRELSKTLHAGDTVYLTGDIYTSRDAGHKRMCETLAKGEKLPFDPMDATIYYVAPRLQSRAR